MRLKKIKYKKLYFRWSCAIYFAWGVWWRLAGKSKSRFCRRWHNWWRRHEGNYNVFFSTYLNMQMEIPIFRLINLTETNKKVDYIRFSHFLLKIVIERSWSFISCFSATWDRNICRLSYSIYKNCDVDFTMASKYIKIRAKICLSIIWLQFYSICWTNIQTLA